MIGELQRAGVGLVVDTRAVAASRRPGFSKRQLAAGLNEAGVGYLHLQKLGTPKEGRDAARRATSPSCSTSTSGISRRRTPREQLDELTAIVKSGRPCVCCATSAMSRHCHRKRIAELICERTGVAAAPSSRRVLLAVTSLGWAARKTCVRVPTLLRCVTHPTSVGLIRPDLLPQSLQLRRRRDAFQESARAIFRGGCGTA